MADGRRKKPIGRRRRNATKASSAPSGYRRIILKFRDYVDLAYSDRVGESIDELRVGPWRQVQRQFVGVTMRRLFTSVEPDALKRLVEEAVRRDATYAPPNFLTYFLVDCPAEVDGIGLARQLADWGTVETAYVDPPKRPPQLIPDPDAQFQGYVLAAEDGIDANFAWGVAGGDGAGQHFVDLEQGWTLDHDELIAHGAQVLNDPPASINDQWRAHGTRVLGVVCASNNGVGYMGIAPNLTSVNVVSEFGSTTPDAILSAIANLPYGGVLLLESELDQVGLEAYPVEVLPAEFAMIRLATALGITVVEAAGNRSDTDLDTFVDAKGNQVFNRGSGGDAFRDSGAIMVSAATATSPHQPMTGTFDGRVYRRHNFGSRIDCYAWGESIRTASSANAADTSGTTSGFGGTSGAAAIVAGAALVVQGVGDARLNYRFSPRQLRALLSDPTLGIPSNDPPNDKLGVMPNLRAIIESDLIGVASDLYLRDFVGDPGDEHVELQCQSPDIILRSAAEPDPEAAFGEGSGTENSVGLGTSAERGQDNYVYVRMKNRGGSDATDVTATVYWAPPATLVTPDLWTLVGEAVLANVPSGDVLTVSDAIVWPAGNVPAAGHYCLVGVVGSAADPAPDLAGLQFPSWDHYLTFIRNNNNVAWRNFNVVSNQPSDLIDLSGFVDMEFIVPGPPDEGREMRLEVVARLPNGSRALLEVPLAMYEAMQDRPPVEINDERRTALIPINPHGLRSLGNMLFTARSRAKLRLLVHIPEERRRMPYDVFVRHMYQDREVGRITWRLAPRNAEGGRRRPGARGRV